MEQSDYLATLKLKTGLRIDFNENSVGQFSRELKIYSKLFAKTLHFRTFYLVQFSRMSFTSACCECSKNAY